MASLSRWITLLLIAVLVAACPHDDGDGYFSGVAEGDSNTRGGFVTTPWPQAAAADAGSLNWHAVNDGVDGQTTADFTSVGIPWLGTHWHGDMTGSNPDVMLLTASTNDGMYAVQHASEITVTPQDVVNSMVAFCNDVQTHMVCFVTTVNIPPIFASGPVHDFLVSLNTLIQSTFPSARTIDLTTGFSDASLYLGDGLHLNQAGHTQRGQTAYNAISAYTP